jgi:hypothetical protein
VDDQPKPGEWPKCRNYNQCGNRVYLRPDERTVCAACEQQGLAPKTELPPLPEPYSQR